MMFKSCEKKSKTITMAVPMFPCSSSLSLVVLTLSYLFSLSRAIMTFPENGVYSLFPDEDLRTGRKIRFEDDRRGRERDNYRDRDRGRGDFPLEHPRDPPRDDFVVDILRPISPGGTRRLENSFESYYNNRDRIGDRDRDRYDLPNIFRDRNRSPRVFFDDEERRVFGYGNKYYHNELPPLSSRETNLIRPSSIDYVADALDNSHRLNNPNFRYLPEAKLPPRARDDDDDNDSPTRIHLFDPNSKFGTGRHGGHKDINVGIPDGPVVVDGPDRSAFLNHEEFLTFHTKIALETLEKEKKKLEEAARRRLFSKPVEEGGISVVGLLPPNPDFSKEQGVTVTEEEDENDNDNDNDNAEEDENNNISTTTNNGLNSNSNSSDSSNNSNNNSVTANPTSTTTGFVPVVPFQLQGISQSNSNVIRLNNSPPNNNNNNNNNQNLSSSSSFSSSSSPSSKFNYNYGNYPFSKNDNGSRDNNNNRNNNANANNDKNDNNEDDHVTTPATTTTIATTSPNNVQFNLPSSFSVFGKKTTTPVNFTPGRIPVSTSTGTSFFGDIRTTSPTLNFISGSSNHTRTQTHITPIQTQTPSPLLHLSVTPAAVPTSSFASSSSSAAGTTFESKKVASISSIPFRKTSLSSFNFPTTSSTPSASSRSSTSTTSPVPSLSPTSTSFSIPTPIPAPAPLAAPFSQDTEHHNQMMIYVQRIRSPGAWRRQTQQSHYFNSTNTNAHKLHLHTHSLNNNNNNNNNNSFKTVTHRSNSSSVNSSSSTNLKIESTVVIRDTQSQSHSNGGQNGGGFSFERAKKRKIPPTLLRDRLSHSDNNKASDNENDGQIPKRDQSLEDDLARPPDSGIAITRNGINGGVVGKVHAHISQCPKLYGDVEIICDVHIRKNNGNPNPQLIIGWKRKFHNDTEDKLIAINKTLAYEEQDFHDKFNVTLAAGISPMLRSVLQIRDVDSQMAGIYQCEVFDGVSKLKSETLLFLCH